MITHLACIMDGNRRWAKSQGAPVWDGHKEGVKAVERVIDFCLQKEIPYLSLYTFSLENFKRPRAELHFLFSILLQNLKERIIADMVDKGVRISFVGDRSLFPKAALSTIQEIEEACASGTKLQVQLLFCYGGRQEIVQGVRNAVKKINAGELDVDLLDDVQFESLLWSGGVPAPDIIIRTGGAQRLSNFLLFQAAYSEFFFLDCYWPALQLEELNEVMNSYTERQRNFGA
jgi:undecaprenyl diphosphate synthase